MQSPPAPQLREEQIVFINIGAFSVAADPLGDRQAIAWIGNFPRGQILVTSSDGRGVEWSALQPVLAPGPTTLYDSSLALSGGETYLAYAAAPGNPTSVRPAFVARSTDGGLTFAAPIALDMASTSTTVSTLALQLVVQERGASDRLFVLATTQSAPFLSVPDRDLLLLVSEDGGLSFAPALTVPSADLGVDVESTRIAVEGDSVYVIWTDDRNDPGGENDVFFRRSEDGGRTWAGPEVRVNTVAGGVAAATFNGVPKIHVAADGDDVVLSWNQTVTGPSQEFRVARSGDRGATVEPDDTIGGYPTGQVFASPTSLVASKGRFYVSWSDARSGTQDVYVASSGDGGRSWNEALVPDPAPSLAGRGGELAADGDLVGVMAPGLSGEYKGSFSLDGGATWAPFATMGDPGVSRFEPRITYDACYRNFTTFWTDAPGGGDSELHTSGFRPQALEPMGFVSGATTVSYGFSGFTGPATALVLVAEEQGDLFLPDGRNLGIEPGPLLRLGLQNEQGIFRTTLSAAGSGTSAPASISLAGPLELVFVALVLDPSEGVFGEITDVVPLSIP